MNLKQNLNYKPRILGINFLSQVKIKGRILIGLLFILLFSCSLFDNNSGVPVNEDIWVNAYLASWQHNPETELINSGTIKTDDIDWEAFTHLTYFSLHISGDGTPSLSLDPNLRYNFNSDRLKNIVPAAHAHNVDIIFSVGGGGNYDGFSAAINEGNRRQFINTISMFITEYGFDGVNLNMTPIEVTDYSNYSAFVKELSTCFDTLKTGRKKRPLLTLAALKTEGISDFYASLQQYFDQMNILTFDMAQPWRGWITWHNSALLNAEVVFENSGDQRLPSVNEKVNEWILAGIDRSKIGIAINFYGSVWSDVHLLDKWEAWPTQDMSIFDTKPYSWLNESYNLLEYEWDNSSKASYLNLSEPKLFISFENERSIAEKMNYAKVNRLGGVMIWELGGGFSEKKTPKDPLLQAIKSHLN